MNRFKMLKHYGLLRTVVVMIVAFAASAITVFAFLNYQLRAQAVELTESLVSSESLALQEGNVASLISKSQRYLIGSRFAENVSVWNQAGTSDARVMSRFGVSMCEPPKMALHQQGLTIMPAGVFRYCTFYRSPLAPDTILAVGFGPGFAPSLFWGSTLFFAIIVCFATVSIAGAASLEHQFRLNILEVALDRLAREDVPLNKKAPLGVWPQLSSEEWLRLESAILKIQTRLLESSKLAAIGRTTQMLAHDVRKPFSMVSLLLDSLQHIDDPKMFKKVSGDMVHEVQRAISSVNSLLQDVMDIGSRAELHLAPEHLETLFESVLSDFFRIYTGADVSISYEFKHRSMVLVDGGRVYRVVMNIVSNALEAMGQKGHLWFRTREVVCDEKLFVEVCIGNDGAAIAVEDQERIFDIFFTKGKRSGTGLGLAIAKSVLDAHGGKIWCRSNPELGVEFYFILPAANRSETLPKIYLPFHSSHVPQEKPKTLQMPEGQEETALEKSILQALEKRQRPFGIAIIDDENLYRSGLKSQLERAPFSDKIRIVTMENGEGAVDVIAQAGVGLVILDIDLGSQTADGFAVLHEIRKHQLPVHVCVHSSRTLVADFRETLERGADSLLPKPMSRIHFLKLILQNVERESGWMAPLTTEETPEKPEFAVLDDSQIVLLAWQLKVKDAVVHTFESPARFWERVEDEPGFLGRLECVVTDHYFDSGSGETGLSFCRDLKNVFTKPVLLSSVVFFEADKSLECVDFRIDKKPRTWSELETLFAKKNAEKTHPQC